MKENMNNVDNNEADTNYIHGKMLASPPPGEEIVISGIAGTFPNSNDMYHYQYNLFNKINMVLPNRRWDYVHPEIPERSGTIPECEHFDAGFFGVHHMQAQAQDTMGRNMLEKVVESIFDAGLSLSDFEGTNTGVYVGTCFSETEKAIFHDKIGPSVSHGFTGCTRSSIAHRISYFLKLNGPSFIADTACSSSLFALETAFRDLRLGKVDSAIVAGSNMCFHPFVSLQFARLGVLSLDGSCKVFDSSGNGYARSEAVVVIILQKSKVAKRKYADIIYVKTNCDGFKEAGITYPSGDAQRMLLTEVYRDTGVDPAQLTYLEAHGTGTVVGDPEECAAIDEVLAKPRNSPLLIGSVKSNIGHPESASGMCSIAKVIIGYETGFIGPNLHFNSPRDTILGIVEGRMKVVTEKTPLPDVKGLIGINSFGFGGGNCHMLLKGNPNEKKNKGIPLDNIPRVTCISGRTEESIVTLLDEIKKTDLDAEFIRLLHNIYRKNIPNHLYRGYSIMSKSGEICRFFGLYSGCKTPLYFVFGELNDWYTIGRDLLILPTFEETLKNAQRLLLSKGINIIDTLFSDSEPIGKYQVLGSILVQLGLTNIFKTLELQPKNYFGHSIGELVSAYFDSILTFKQIVDVAFLLNDVIDKTNDVFKKRQDKKSMSNIQMNGNLNTSTILANFSSYLHSSELTNTKKELLSNLSNILNKPQNQINGKEEKFGSADYFVNALTADFSTKFEYVESSSIILSFGTLPKAAPVLDDVKIIKLGISKDNNNLLQFLKILGNIYINGYEPQLAKLYPEVKFPVSRGTKMISPFIKWNHERTWFTPEYKLQAKASLQQGQRRIKLQVSDQQWNFVKGHVVDGRNLFPATGYLYLVWEALCLIEEMPMDVKHLIFQDCRFLRATNLPKKGNVIFEISVNRFSGKFEIIEGDSVVVRGRITSHDIEEVEKVESISVQKELSMNSKDVYKELRLRGYNYSGGFRSIEKCSIDASAAFIKWENNWITFLDNLLQLKILQSDTRLLYVPTYIEYLRLPARNHLDWVNNEFVNKNVEPILPVICNQYTGEIRCGNIVIKGLIASSISRRKDFGIPVLESYQFVPNNMNFSLEESIRVNSQIVLENCLIKKVKVVELVDEFAKNETLLIPIIHTAFEDQPLIQPLSKILSKNTIQTSIPIEDNELSTEVDCNIIIGTQLTSRTDAMKVAYTCLKDNGFIISREPLDFTESSIALEHFTVFTVHTTPAEIIVLLKKNSKNKELVTLNIESSDEEYLWVDTLKNIIKQKKSDNVLLYSQNEDTSGLLGLVNCLRREPESGFIKCLLLLDIAEDFDKNKPFYKNQLQKNMAINIWKNGRWGTYRHLLLPELKQVKTEHCYINTTVRGDLASLRWIENTLNADTIVPPEKMLVKVQYASINFRDVMTTSGRINVDVITEDRLEQECTQGFEFSGIDTEGNRIMGMLDHGALSTLVLADNYLLFKVPDDYTLEEAATIPVVYGTVIYGMIIRGKLQKNDKVLIHSGTGGVGQAGIRLALHYECEVFTTVGTEAKKEYLLKTFPQLKESNIGNSHDVSFEKMIIKETNGQGVDMVLNSLADEKLLASVRCLGRGGRFIEIGKFDLAKNTELNFLLLEKEASFHGVMLDNLISSPPDIKKEVSDILNTNIKKFVVPLPTNVFGYNQIEDAFRFMGTGKHMGKVLIKIREDEDMFNTKLEKFSGLPRYLCNPHKTYVIIGGLGGFGLELTDWLIIRGAKNLVLTSRKGVSTGYQKMRLKIWSSYGVRIHISKEDICTEQGCRDMLKKANELGDVHAIFNLAVVLADSIFENQTDATFKTSFGPKAIATAHLDNLSRILCPQLKDFVIFSSVTCGRGNAGQTNYGMANSVMERICEKRKKEGYPALAVQWGAIGDVGLVAELQEEHVELEIGGTLQQKIQSCLNVLNNFLRQKHATIVSSMVVAEKKGGLDSCDNIVDTVINILGLTDAKVVSHHATLPELGMDSMTGVEIKQTLEREFEVFLSPKDMKTMTLAKLKEIQEQKCLTVDEDEVDYLTMMISSQLEDEEEMNLTDIHLNPNLKTNNPLNILMFPGIEGFARSFGFLSTHMDSKVIGLQYWDNISTQTVQEIARGLLPTVESYIKPNELFNFVGYSFGSIVALEVVNLLEEKGYIGNITIVDGGPLFMKKLIMQVMRDSDIAFETELLMQLLSYHMPVETIVKNHKEKFVNANSWEERINVARDIIISIKPEVVDHHTKFANGLYYRAKATANYIPSYEKLKSKIKLIKPSMKTVSDIPDDFGLLQYSEHPVEYETVEGNHTTILSNEQLAQMINASFTEKRKEV